MQVGKAVVGKEIYTTLGIEPRTYSYPGKSGNPCRCTPVGKTSYKNFFSFGHCPIGGGGLARNLLAFYPPLPDFKAAKEKEANTLLLVGSETRAKKDSAKLIV